MATKKPTPKQALDAAVFQVKAVRDPDQEALVGTWACLCPIDDGSCGSVAEDGDRTSFYSPGWPTKAIARDRLDVHIADHLGEPAPDLQAFREKHGLQQADDGLRAVFTAKDFVS